MAQFETRLSPPPPPQSRGRRGEASVANVRLPLPLAGEGWVRAFGGRVRFAYGHPAQQMKHGPAWKGRSKEKQ
jgi:hypothetical protein